MAHPAHESADGREPAEPEQQPDPRARGWADVRVALVTASRACALAVAELARDPGNPAALDMAGTTLACLEALGEIGRRWVLDEQVLENVRAEAHAEGYAACKAARCRLSAVPG